MTVTSQASFPIANDFVYYNDTIIPDTSQNISQESIDQYHERIQKQGFDIDNCMCESCRDGIAVKQSKTLTSGSSNSLYKTAAILFALALIVFVVSMLDGVACINDVSTCSSSNTPLIVYISLLMIFGYLSIFYFIKGLLAQKKDK